MAQSLWTSEPVWTAESPDRLYALFRAYADSKGKLTQAEDGEFTLLLMALVDMQFRQHRVAKMLAQVSISAEDVAQEVVLHLRRKCTFGMGLRPAQYGDAWKQMISAMNVAIYRFVLTEVGRGKRRHWRESTTTDHEARRPIDGRTGAGLVEAESAGRGGDGPTAAGLFRALAAAEEDVLGDLVGTASDADRFERLYRAVIVQIRTQRTPSPHGALPPELKEIPRETHALVVSRILRIVWDYAGS